MGWRWGGLGGGLAPARGHYSLENNFVNIWRNCQDYTQKGSYGNVNLRQAHERDLHQQQYCRER